MPDVPDRTASAFDSAGDEPAGPGTTADPETDIGAETVEDASVTGGASVTPDAGGESAVGAASGETPTVAGQDRLVDLLGTALEQGQPMFELTGRVALGEVFPEVPGLGDPPPMGEEFEAQLDEMDGVEAGQSADVSMDAGR